jgi:hypothetical protein
VLGTATHILFLSRGQQWPLSFFESVSTAPLSASHLWQSRGEWRLDLDVLGKPLVRVPPTVVMSERPRSRCPPREREVLQCHGFDGGKTEAEAQVGEVEHRALSVDYQTRHTGVHET